ncbi:MAG: biotin--[acetyl-CoA-carboxylase] ligase [Planctomycetes bacterium]|nr:biotin--[acetyl-CoA-carboxylase] ligase [Planctomycetota bacterium]
MTAPADRVLNFLGETAEWLSGEELARLLGISRAAVAKHIAKLRRDGHIIKSSTKLGYRLLAKNVPVDFDLVVPHLWTKTLGRTGWRSLDVTESTNNEAIIWALAGGPVGAVVPAERQTGGKGRRGHGWFSPPRSLMFSCILPAGPRHRSSPEAVTGEALAALVEAFCQAGVPEPTVKSPNDLLLNGRKIAGVLVESGSRAGVPEWLVLGIGVNVNVLQEEFPDELSGRATSILAVTGRPMDRNAFLGIILSEIERKLRA